MPFEFGEKTELSHTHQVENPVHVIHYPHCNKGNKTEALQGLEW